MCIVGPECPALEDHYIFGNLVDGDDRYVSMSSFDAQWTNPCGDVNALILNMCTSDLGSGAGSAIPASDSTTPGTRRTVLYYDILFIS